MWNVEWSSTWINNRLLRAENCLQPFLIDDRPSNFQKVTLTIVPSRSIRKINFFIYLDREYEISRSVVTTNDQNIRMIFLRELTFDKVTSCWKYKLNIWEISEISFNARTIETSCDNCVVFWKFRILLNIKILSNSWKWTNRVEISSMKYTMFERKRDEIFIWKKESTFHRPDIFEKKASCFSFRKNPAAAWKFEKSMERRLRASSGHRHADR